MSSPRSLMQLQTEAGSGSPSPSPTAKPISITKTKNSSDESLASRSSSTSASSSTGPSSWRGPGFDVVRCSRCQRSLSIHTAGPATQQGAVRFGTNAYYCTRCASHVGFVK